MQDVLVRSFSHIRFLAISTGPYFRLGENGELIDMPDESTWWQMHHPKEYGENDLQVELIPQLKGEVLKRRLHGMDYESLSMLKEIDLD